MRGTLMLARLEMVRVLRNRRYLLFTIGLPVVLYLTIGRTRAQAYGVNFSAFYMVAMASIGAFSGALTGNAQRISQERKDGWIRQQHRACRHRGGPGALTCRPPTGPGLAAPSACCWPRTST